MAVGLGSAPSIIVGAAVGGAASAALRPALELPRQGGWERNPHRVLDPNLLARLVAEGGVQLDAAYAEAKREGFDSDKVDALVYLAQTVPAIGEALALYRRKLMSPELWKHVLVKSGLDQRYVQVFDDALETEPLSPPDVAYAIVRGLMHDDGLLPVAPPTEGGKVKRFPVSDIDAVEEAAKSGYSRERLRVLVGRSGLSIAPIMAAHAFFRGIIERVDYDLAIAEGDLRNEWRDAILAVSRQILTPHEYAELRLRAWIDDKQMHDGAALSGMDKGEVDLLHKMMGRPLSWHQTFIALRRGGEYDGPVDELPHAFLRSLQESDIRPEWYNLAWHSRYTYPTAFVLRALANDGALDHDTLEQTLLYEGWEPKFAAKVADHYGRKSAAKPKELTAAQLQSEYEGRYISATDFLDKLKTLGYTDEEAQQYAQLADAKRVQRARDARINKIRAQYVAHRISEQQASAALADTQIPNEAQQLLMDEWTATREINVAVLTPAQIKKAYTTGQWTQQQALAELIDRGYTETDASTLLAE